MNDCEYFSLIFFLKSKFFLIDRSYQANRYKDEVTDSNNNHADTHQHEYTPASKSSFQNHLNRLDERFGQTYKTRNKGNI
jgi:hypothetical protein